jgi:hypothetical protein
MGHDEKCASKKTMSEPAPDTIDPVNILSSGIPLVEYESAFGWNNWDSPLKVIDNDLICTKCKISIVGVPNPVERHAHTQSCKPYAEWRRQRWENFNNSLIGKLLSIEFKKYWFGYYNLELTPETSGNAIGKLLGNFVNKEEK